MSPWLITVTAALLLGWVPCGIVCLRGKAMERLVALQLAGVISVLALLMLAVGFRRAPYFDVALTLAILSLAPAAGAVGLALFALFRQWLPLDLSRLWRKLVVQPVAGLKALHNGHAGDYVTWLTIGVAVLGGIGVFILL